MRARLASVNEVLELTNSVDTNLNEVNPIASRPSLHIKSHHLSQQSESHC